MNRLKAVMSRKRKESMGWILQYRRPESIPDTEKRLDTAVDTIDVLEMLLTNWYLESMEFLDELTIPCLTDKITRIKRFEFLNLSNDYYDIGIMIVK